MKFFTYFDNILPCEHKFHENCLSLWIYTKLNCPICRKDFRKK